MATNKAFLIVEALDSPKGAMLVRYQTVERIEPDQEEVRVAKADLEEHLAECPEEIRESFKAQIASMKALLNPTASYRIETKMVVCTSPEEVTASIKEAKEADEEIRRLIKSGTKLDMSAPRGLTTH